MVHRMPIGKEFLTPHLSIFILYRAQKKKLAKNLDEAVEYRDIVKVRSVLEQGADPNHQLYWSEEWKPWEPPLHWGFLEIVKTLVTHGACTDKAGGWLNRVPLHYACVRGNIKRWSGGWM